MISRTIYLSRLIGLYCILVDLSLIIHRPGSVGSIVAVFNDPAVMLTLGIATVAAGLAMVLAHNIWSGGAPTVVVTLVGWLALIKGVLFLALPAGVEREMIVGWLRTPTCFYVCLAPSLLIGIYLTVCGFRTRAS